MLTVTGAGVVIDSVAHIIQVALTPVFLLSAIGTLLNVFNTRLARVSDHTEHTTELLANEADERKAFVLARHLHRLSRRTLALDIAVGLGALAGAMTCCAAVALFVGTLRDAASGAVLFVLFGTALFATIGALGAFFGDSVLAWHGLKREGALPHAGGKMVADRQ